ncbi:MAG TPA: cupin domain-containing protein [Phycisphaerales bacterium]|nr:cupin domain-containing protein [Phycisphaerales bacterium]
MTATVYRWSELAVDRPMERITRRRVVGANVMISHVTLERGFVVPPHSHSNEQMVCVISGALRFTLAGSERVVRAGEVLHLPGGVEHGAEAIEDSVVMDVFSPVSEKTGVDRQSEK